MKKTTYCSLITILTLTSFLIGCKNEKSDENVLPRLREVEHYYYDITHKYTDATQTTLVEADTVLTITTEHWTWDNDRVSKIETYEGGTLKHTIEYATTERGTLMTDSRDPSQKTLYIYDAEHIDSIIRYDNNERTWDCDFLYKDDEITQAIVGSYSNGALIGSTTYNLTFENGDLMQMDYVSDGTKSVKTYTYGSAANPYRMTDRSLTHLNLSHHIALIEDYKYTDNYGSEKNDHREYNYTMQDGLPQTMEHKAESDVGKYHNIYIHRYVYRY